MGADAPKRPFAEFAQKLIVFDAGAATKAGSAPVIELKRLGRRMGRGRLSGHDHGRT